MAFPVKNKTANDDESVQSETPASPVLSKTNAPAKEVMKKRSKYGQSGKVKNRKAFASIMAKKKV